MSFRKRWDALPKWLRESLEQLGHGFLGWVVHALILSGVLELFGATIPAVVGGTVAGYWVSAFAGSLREGLQNWGDALRKGSLEDMLVDLSFWKFGNSLGPLIALAF